MENSMKRTLRLCTALAAAGSLGTAGCENFSATEAGLIAAGLAGAATGIALGTTGVPASSAVPIALGAAAGAGALAVAATNMQVGRDQRLVAEQRGQMLVDQARQRGAQNIPRYILVDTISARPTGGGRPVMIQLQLQIIHQKTHIHIRRGDFALLLQTPLHLRE